MLKSITGVRAFRQLCKISVYKEHKRLGLQTLSSYSRNTGHQRRLHTMKIETQEFRQLFTPELKRLMELFDKYQFELRIAGGAVCILCVKNRR